MGHADAIVLELPISNVGMEANTLNGNQWDALVRFARSAFCGRENLRDNIVIIDVLQKGRSVAFVRKLLGRCCGVQKKIAICSLGAVPQEDIRETRDLALKDITQIGIRDEHADAVCRNIVMCTYKNIKLLKKYDQHSLLKIASGEILTPRKNIGCSLRLFKTIRELDWVRPGKPAADILDAYVMEHDMVRAITCACVHTANEGAVAWLRAALAQVSGLTEDNYMKARVSQTRFYHLYGASLSALQVWLAESTALTEAQKNRYGSLFNTYFEPDSEEDDATLG